MAKSGQRFIVPAEYDVLVDFSPAANSNGTKEISEYASIQIEAQYFKEIDIEVRASESAHNVFRPGERDMIAVIESLRAMYSKLKIKNGGEGGKNDKVIEGEEGGGGMIEVDLSGVELGGPNGLVIAAGTLLILIACATVFIMVRRRNSSVQRLSVVIKERFSSLENGKTIRVKKTVGNNTVDVIDG